MTETTELVRLTYQSFLTAEERKKLRCALNPYTVEYQMAVMLGYQWPSAACTSVCAFLWEICNDGVPE